MKKLSLIIFILFSFAFVAVAVESMKPASHDAAWIENHGKQAKAKRVECLTCHDERNECISCHEDKAPRSHSASFVNRTHGIEARWNKNSCQVCHRQDFCASCHSTAVPKSHNRAGFGEGDRSAGSHCGTTCILPSGSWKNTPSKNCIVCHQNRPMTNEGVPHRMN